MLENLDQVLMGLLHTSLSVYRVPITCFMWDKKSGNLKIIAEYGQDYGKENPVCVLYHGYGHYDALRSPKPNL